MDYHAEAAARESWFGTDTSISSQRERSIGPSSRGITKGSKVSQYGFCVVKHEYSTRRCGERANLEMILLRRLGQESLDDGELERVGWITVRLL